VLPEIASLNVYSSVQRGTIISKALNRVTGVGIGLERISAVIGGLGHVFDLPPLAAIAEAVAGRSARHPVFVVNRIDVYRLADRLRTIVFALADGQRLDESPRSRLLVEMFRGAEKTASLRGLSLDAAMERALVAMLPHYESECPPLADMLIVIKDFCRHWREYPTRR
jgi:alanyl-tRNA synthetase